MTSTKRIPTKRTSLRKGPVCSVCRSEHRVLIEQARIVGCSLDTISAKYNVSRDSVFRHMRAHVSEDLRAEYLAAVPLAELAQKAASEGLSVLQYLSIVRSTLLNAFQLAANVGDRNGTAILAGRLNETLRTIGQLSGELGDMAMRSVTINGNINIMSNPVLANLQANILKALAPFPAAREAVIGALRAMDAPVDELAASAGPPNGSEKLLELQVLHAD
jgi:hypothetical protein